MLVCAAIIREGDNLLIAKRGFGKKLAGKWEFPGGKAEIGESPEESLIREIREELGLEVEVGSLITAVEHSYGEESIKLLAYEAKIYSKKFRLNSHDDVVFASINDLKNYDLAEADLKLLPAIERWMAQDAYFQRK